MISALKRKRTDKKLAVIENPNVKGTNHYLVALIKEKKRQVSLTSIMIVNIRASKPRVQPGVEGEEVFLEDCYQILFLPKPFSLLYFILDQVESVESAIEPDRKEIKRRRPHEKTFRKVTHILREP